MAMELRPDVIVMDINMPGMDGVAAAEIISQRLPTSPIIMMSVHGEAEQLEAIHLRRRARVPGQAVQRRRVLDQHPAASTSASSFAASRSHRPCRLPPVAAPLDAADLRRAPGHRRLLAQGRRGTHDHRHQPGAGAAARDERPRLPGRCQPPVRRRRRPAEPESQESVHARRRRGWRAGRATSPTRW